MGVWETTFGGAVAADVMLFRAVLLCCVVFSFAVDVVSVCSVGWLVLVIPGWSWRFCFVLTTTISCLISVVYNCLFYDVAGIRAA